MTDLLGGSVDLTITTPPPLMAHIAAGKLRPLVVTSKTRLPSLKDVPSRPRPATPTWTCRRGLRCTRRPARPSR